MAAKSEPVSSHRCGQLPVRRLTVGVFGWTQEPFLSLSLSLSFYFLLCMDRTGMDTGSVPDTIHHTVKEKKHEKKERERERAGMRWGRGGMAPFITMVTNGTINHSTPPQLSSHPQSERQSLGPGLLEQHGH